MDEWPDFSANSEPAPADAVQGWIVSDGEAVIEDGSYRCLRV
jgi:hypothetical protein